MSAYLVGSDANANIVTDDIGNYALDNPTDEIWMGIQISLMPVFHLIG